MRVVTLKELVRRAAATTQTPNDVGIKVVDSLFDLAIKELDQGNRVELGSGLSPLAMKVKPALGSTKAKDKLADRNAPFSIAVVVPKKDFFINILAERLSGPRSKTVIHEGIDAFKVSLSDNKPDLVVLDSSLEHSGDLVRSIKEERDTSMVAAVLVNPEDHDTTRVDGLQVIEDGALTEPYELTELVELAEGEIRRSHEERAFFDHQIRFHFPTRDDTIEAANDLAGKLLEQSGMNEERAAALAVAFREAVDNGARHGNKSQESRLLEAVYLLDKDKTTITITDEGDGFDTEMYLSRGAKGNAVAVARERNEAGRTGGLGIMLMLKCLDNLEYNYAGNQVKLTKYIK
jgi:anti-sigma regulatory factor (Ser/Thr protein kinase)